MAKSKKSKGSKGSKGSDNSALMWGAAILGGLYFMSQGEAEAVVAPPEPLPAPERPSALKRLFNPNANDPFEAEKAKTAAQNMVIRAEASDFSVKLAQNPDGQYLVVFPRVSDAEPDGVEPDEVDDIEALAANNDARYGTSHTLTEQANRVVVTFGEARSVIAER